MSNERDVVVRGRAAGFVHAIAAGRHRLFSDEPAAAGGTDQGPNPYDLLLAALGSCTSMTIALYARRKQWPLEDVVVRLRHSRVHAADCEDCETKAGMLDRIDRELELKGPLAKLGSDGVQVDPGVGRARPHAGMKLTVEGGVAGLLPVMHPKGSRARRTRD